MLAVYKPVNVKNTVSDSDCVSWICAEDFIIFIFILLHFAKGLCLLLCPVILC